MLYAKTELKWSLHSLVQNYQRLISHIPPFHKCVYLGLFHSCVVSITHGADIQALLSFFVTLLEEFFNDVIYPLEINLGRLGWIGQICTMDHVLKELKRHGTRKKYFLQKELNHILVHGPKFYIVNHCPTQTIGTWTEFQVPFV